jgi:hypothetical protein
MLCDCEPIQNPCDAAPGGVYSLCSGASRFPTGCHGREPAVLGY